MEPLYDSRTSPMTSLVISQPNNVLAFTKPVDHNLIGHWGYQVPQADKVRRPKVGKILAGEDLTQPYGHNEVMIILSRELSMMF